MATPRKAATRKDVVDNEPVEEVPVVNFFCARDLYRAFNRESPLPGDIPDHATSANDAAAAAAGTVTLHHGSTRDVGIDEMRSLLSLIHSAAAEHECDQAGGGAVVTGLGGNNVSKDMSFVMPTFSRDLRSFDRNCFSQGGPLQMPGHVPSVHHDGPDSGTWTMRRFTRPGGQGRPEHVARGAFSSESSGGSGGSNELRRGTAVSGGSSSQSNSTSLSAAAAVSVSPMPSSSVPDVCFLRDVGSKVGRLRSHGRSGVTEDRTPQQSAFEESQLEAMSFTTNARP